MRVILIAPYYDQNVPGESWSTYKWIQGISEHCEVTVLTTHHRGWDSSQSPTQAKEVINWIDPSVPTSLARLNHELKPTYALFYLRCRRWLRRLSSRIKEFDVIHQINPLALRYPSPAAGVGIPYILGPLAGSLDTPSGFREEVKERLWFRRLRGLDRIRLRYDPVLRATYRNAAIVVGVAPYVKELVALAGFQRFAVESETGIEQINQRSFGPRPFGRAFRLLFVGRIIRTKGILEAIRAVAIASKQCRLKFDVIGEGDLLRHCKAEAVKLEIANLVFFHGRLPRSMLASAYQNADVFLFPSFREPSGNVIFEAMSHGLPVITSTIGGPASVVTDNAGIKVNPTTPDEFISKLAEAIINLYSSESALKAFSIGALERVNEVGYWPTKIKRMLSLYTADLSPLRVSKYNGYLEHE